MKSQKQKQESEAGSSSKSTSKTIAGAAFWIAHNGYKHKVHIIFHLTFQADRSKPAAHLEGTLISKI